MKLNSLIVLLITFSSLHAQEAEKVFTKVEIESGTDRKHWNEHIRKATQLPDSIKAEIPAGVYKVNVQFVIDVHGNIGQVKAKNDPGFGLAKKAVNAVSSYGGTWKPASQCGRNVKSYKEEVISFSVGDQ